MTDPKPVPSCVSSGAPEVSLRRMQPSPWVERFYCGIKANGHVLDIACGAGRHFPLGIASAKRTTGIDRDLSKAARFKGLPGIQLIEADLEGGSPLPFRGSRYDGVIVTNYLWRPILPDVVAAVAPDGILIYETFGIGQEAFGRPSNPDFLLQPGELMAAVEGRLRIVAYEHATLRQPERIVQRIAAVGPEHRWPGRKPPAA